MLLNFLRFLIFLATITSHDHFHKLSSAPSDETDVEQHHFQNVCTRILL